MMTTTWIGSVCLLAIVPFQILLALGFPLGEFTLGGKHKVLPDKLRYVSAISVIIILLMVTVLLHLGGVIQLAYPFSPRAFTYVGYIIGGYFVLNTLANLLSKSWKEKYVMTPLSAIVAFCFWHTTYHSALWN